jgi:hypothetical protein
MLERKTVKDKFKLTAVALANKVARNRLRADDEGWPIRRPAGHGLNERGYSTGSFRRQGRSASRAPTK